MARDQIRAVARSLSFLFLVLLQGTAWGEQAVELTINVEKRYESTNAVHMLNGMAFSPVTGHLYMGVTQFVKEADGFAVSFLIWELDQEGNKLKEIPLFEADGHVPVPAPRLRPSCIGLLPGGDLLVVTAAFSGSPPLVVRVHPNGQMVFKKPLARSRDCLMPQQLVRWDDTHWGLLGQKRGKVAFLKLDHDGNITVEKLYDLGGMGTCFDGLVLDRQEYLLSGFSWQDGASKAWIIKVNAQGELLKKVEFENFIKLPGPGYEMARTSTGNVALCYPSRKDGHNYTSLRVFDTNLTELSQRDVFEMSDLAGRKRMAAIPGGLMIAGVIGPQSSYLHLLDEGGQVIVKKAFEGAYQNLHSTWLQVVEGKAFVGVSAWRGDDSAAAEVKTLVVTCNRPQTQP